MNFAWDIISFQNVQNCFLGKLDKERRPLSYEFEQVVEKEH